MAADHQICRLFSKDKQFQIIWDINKLLQDLVNMSFNVEYKDVLRLSEQDGGICTDPEYAMITDISKPCVIIKLDENVEIFIDGNHRLYKARMLEAKNIPCFVLPAEYHKKFIIDYDANIYEKVIADYCTE